MKTKTILLTLIISAVGFTTSAQGDYSVKQIAIQVAGTSTLHDWEMTASEAKGQAVLVMDNDKLVAVKDLNLTLAAENLKSDKEAMDNNAYKSLKTSQYKSILFNLVKVTNVTAGSITVEGRLEIAGVAKVVSLTASYTVADGTLRFKGEKKLKMSDFNVEPPTFMFGTIKTGDEITVSYDLTITKNSI